MGFPVSELNSSQLESAVIGMVLGDGSISRTPGNMRLRIGHSKKQLEWLKLKKEMLESQFGIRLEFHNWKQRLQNGKTYECSAIEFAHKYFTNLYTRMFRMDQDGHYIKTITRDILDKLDPLGILIWYLDDGYLSIQYANTPSGRRIHDRKLKWATHCFSEAENEIIKKWLFETYGIQSRVYKPEPKKKPWQRALYMNATNTKKFLDLIRPFKPEGIFDKKFDMRYSEDASTFAVENSTEDIV